MQVLGILAGILISILLVLGLERFLNWLSLKSQLNFLLGFFYVSAVVVTIMVVCLIVVGETPLWNGVIGLLEIYLLLSFYIGMLILTKKQIKREKRD